MWIALITLVPRSNKATVVPTGIAALASPMFVSAIAAKRFPESTKIPSKLISTLLGSLIGNGIRFSLKDPPVVSMSLNSPGCNGSSSSLILMPLALKPAGKLANVPASISCLNIDVLAFDIPPIMCDRPNP